MPRGRKKGAGGQLNRTEMLQARLSPKLRLMAELMARADRRTVSSLIEGLIEKAAQETSIEAVPLEKAGYVEAMRNNPKIQTTVAQAVENMWEPGNEGSRFVAFAFCFPHLLTDYEFRLWRLIKISPYFWKNFPITITTEKGEVVKEWAKDVEYSGLLHDHLKQYWKEINDHIAKNLDYTNPPPGCMEIGEKCSTPINNPKYDEVWERNMTVKYQKITRAGQRQLQAGQKLEEHGIGFERLTNGDGRSYG